MPNSVRRDKFWVWLFLILFSAAFSAAHAEKITFEESISVPDAIRTQYCAKGVQVLTAARIFEPPVATSSPVHALTNYFVGGEFDTPNKLEISFAAGQSQVAVRVGLDRDYPTMTFGLVAIISAYSSPTPGTGFIAYSTVELGNSRTSVTKTLSVSSALGNIHSISISFEGASPMQAGYEVIDDLEFTTVASSCGADDKTAPTITVTEPTAGQSIYSSTVPLDFTVADGGSGVAKIAVSIVKIAGDVIETFYPCGGGGGSLCSPSDKVHYSFYTSVTQTLSAGTHPFYVRIKAWDYAGNSSQEERGVIYHAYAPSVNLWVQGMEITQGTQPWMATYMGGRKSGSTPPTEQYPSAPTAVPLVAGRTTVVRVYPGLEGSSGWQVSGVKAVLRCYTDAAYSRVCPGNATITPQTEKITVNPSASLDTMRYTAGGWLFVLPRAWTGAGQVFLEAEVLPPASISECLGCKDAANRIRVSKVQFNSVPHALNSLFHFVSVNRKVNGVIHSPTQAQIRTQIDFLAGLSPVDETTLPTTALASTTYEDRESDSTEDRCGTMIDHIKSAFSNKGGKEEVHAFTDAGLPCQGVGTKGYSFGNVASLENAAHEIGHGFGLKHSGNPPGHGSYCPRPDGGDCAECQNNWCDTDWPWQGGTIGAYGYDFLNMRVIPDLRLECKISGVCDNGVNEDGDKWPNGWPKIDEDCPGAGTDWASHPHDVMSYGGCLFWISPRNWIRLFNAFTGSSLSYPQKTSTTSVEATDAGGRASQLSGGAVPAESKGLYLLVRGAFERGRWRLAPAYEIEPPPGRPRAPGRGEYCVQLLSGGARVVSEQCFNIPTQHVDTVDEDGSRNALSARPSFSLFLPRPREADTIVLRQGEQVLARAERSRNAPIVEILSPSGSGFRGQPDDPIVQWKARDPDRDRLYYMIQYSQSARPGRGHDWQTLAVDVTEQQLAIRSASLAGSSGAVVRVLASDGFNTVTVVSPPFAVMGKPPHVRILSGERMLTMERGSRRVLQGSASDPEEGSLDGSRLTWRSHRDGLLGNGHQIDLTRLNPGVHEITLSGKDRDGMVGSEALTVRVLERRNTQPLADAGPDLVIGKGQTVHLDGVGSSDADGDPLIFQWSVVSKPRDGEYVLGDADSARPSFLATAAGQYQIQLIVNDRKVPSAPDALIVAVHDAAVCSPAFRSLSSWFGSDGGAGSVVVIAPADCGWKAASSAEWLVVTTRGIRNGSSVIAFKVLENVAGRTRRASLDIGGNLFEVTQLGDRPDLAN